MRTLRLGKSTLSITDAEADVLGPLMIALGALADQPFAHDPSPAFRSPPAHYCTPARIRALVNRRLEGLARCEDLARRLLAELELNGVPFADVEAGASIAPKHAREIAGARRRSRIFR